MSFRDWLSPPAAKAKAANPANAGGDQNGTLAALATLALATARESQSDSTAETVAASVDDASADVEAGWRERHEAAQWGREASAVESEWRLNLERWPGYWQPPERYETNCRINEYVAAWNRVTGQTCSPAGVRARLAPDDYLDPIKINRGALMLLTFHTFTSEPTHEPNREALEERAAIHEFEAGFSRAEAERRAGLKPDEQQGAERQRQDGSRGSASTRPTCS